MKAEITVQVEGEEATVRNVIQDLILLLRNIDEPICEDDFLIEVTPHYHRTDDGIILDHDLIKSWEGSTYLSLEDILELFSTTHVQGKPLLPPTANYYSEHSVKLPNEFFNLVNQLID